MAKPEENLIIYNEDIIDLESNYDDIDNASEVSEQTNIQSRIDEDMLYMLTQIHKISEDIDNDNNLSHKISEDIDNDNNLSHKKSEYINDVDTLLRDVHLKVGRLNDIQTLLEFKLSHNKEQFRKHNFRLLILTVLLTFIEVLYKQFDIVNSSQLVSGVTKNIVLLIPILLTSLITLLSAWIKNLKFEEIIENISRGIEKLITAKLKLQKMLEDVGIEIKKNNNYTKEEFDKLIKGKYKNGLDEYLEARSIADKNYTPKDLSKYLSEYLKTKKNEKKLEIGRIKIYNKLQVDTQKIEKKSEINKNKIEKDGNIKKEIHNKFKEYELKKYNMLLNIKLKNLERGIIPVNDRDISHMIEKENKIYTKIKKFINYLFDR
jgi:hypothetical protein